MVEPQPQLEHRRPRNPNLKTIGICLVKETIEKCDQIVFTRTIPGIYSRSALIDYALRKMFDEVLGKSAPQPEPQAQPQPGEQKQ